jgi:hypothetical protein
MVTESAECLSRRWFHCGECRRQARCTLTAATRSGALGPGARTPGVPSPSPVRFRAGAASAPRHAWCPRRDKGRRRLLAQDLQGRLFSEHQSAHEPRCGETRVSALVQQMGAEHTQSRDRAVPCLRVPRPRSRLERHPADRVVGRALKSLARLTFRTLAQRSNLDSQPGMVACAGGRIVSSVILFRHERALSGWCHFSRSSCLGFRGMRRRFSG